MSCRQIFDLKFWLSIEQLNRYSFALQYCKGDKRYSHEGCQCLKANAATHPDGNSCACHFFSTSLKKLADILILVQTNGTFLLRSFQSFRNVCTLRKMIVMSPNCFFRLVLCLKKFEMHHICPRCTQIYK